MTGLVARHRDKLVVTIHAGVGEHGMVQEDLDYIREDCEDVLRGMGAFGVAIEVQVMRGDA